MTTTSTTLVWFRQDLRLQDNPAWQAALERGGKILPVFLWVPEEAGAWSLGGASRWWLHQSLQALQHSLHSKLILRQGKSSGALLQALIQEAGVDQVYWNRRYDPELIAVDQKIKSQLQERGVTVRSFKANLLWEPWQVKNQSGGPYKVFTPFWKNISSLDYPPHPKSTTATAHTLASVASERLSDFELEPKIDWAKGFRETWQPGEAGAQEALKTFLHEAMEDYLEGRDCPGSLGTSRLSPHLHFGEISPWRIWEAVHSELKQNDSPKLRKNGLGFLRELGWREFAHHLLYHFPETTEKPLRPEFEKFPWEKPTKLLRAWQRGQTGFPLVDAGMRELWHCGWMHNRVRMIVASFLVKDLRVHWLEGARWFWDTLVDADLANNTLGWQWTAGCGADASLFFRVFNPTSQAAKFDPQGQYIRRWVPELAKLEPPYLFQPEKAPEAALSRAGIVLGEDYPRPIVDHGECRNRALEIFRGLKR